MTKALPENLQKPSYPQNSYPLVLARHTITAILGLVCYLVSPIISRAQSLDSFNPSANNQVLAIGVQVDNRIIVGGAFTALAGQPRHRLGRLNVDGSLDPTFDPNVDPLANSSVYGLAMQDDGKILIAGSFTTVGGRAASCVARLNPDGSVDTNFNAVANNVVYAVALQPDGKILLGGIFTQLGNQTRNHLGRLNADGTVDPSFNPGANSFVYAIALQTNGSILVGGSFTTLGGQTQTRLGRVSSDGVLDATFNPSPDGQVRTIALQGDSKIIIGGGFVAVGGQTHPYVARLNSDGSPDSAFTNAANGTVFCLGLQADGKILMGGAFTTFGGQTRSHVARINADGTLDLTFITPANGEVDALVLQSDGKVLVGGLFTAVAGQVRNRLARVSNTTSPDINLAFDGSVISWSRGGSAPEVWRTAFQGSTNGDVWVSLGDGIRNATDWQLSTSFPTNATILAQGYAVGGYGGASSWTVQTSIGQVAFTLQPSDLSKNAGSTASFGVSAVGTSPLAFQWFKNSQALNDGANIFGSQTATLTVSNVLGADAGQYSVLVTNSMGAQTSQQASLIVIDPVINAQPASQSVQGGGIAVLSAAATGSSPLVFTWYRAGIPVMTSAAASPSTLVISNAQLADAGDYFVVVSNAFGSITSTVVTLTVDLTTLNPFDPGANGGAVYSMVQQTDGKILAGGYFTSLGGQNLSYLGRLNEDGTLDTAFNPAPDGFVQCIATSPDGRILVGGSFGNLGGQACSNFGRLNQDGSLDTNFNAGVSGTASPTVYSLVVQADGKILVGGTFTTLAGTNRLNVGRLNPDGTLDEGFDPTAGGLYPPPNVTAMAVQPDGKIIIGGDFTSLGGQPQNYIGRLNSDGSLDTTFVASADAGISSIALQPDGKILVAGVFSSLVGQPRSYLGRLNSDGSLDTSFHPQVYSFIASMVLQADGKIIIGGQFTSLGGLARNYIGRLDQDGKIDPTFDPSASFYVDTLALKTDGSVLVGGAFTSLRGLPRNYIGQLQNTDTAIQSLVLSGQKAAWLQNGTAPEISGVTFDCSTDGTNWISLGGASRIPGGWQIESPTILTSIAIHSGGYAPAGFNNGSEQFVESTWRPLRILQVTTRSGSSSNSFGFTYSGPPGQNVIVETSTDFQVWLPLETNVLGQGVNFFSEIDPSIADHEFFRLRVP
jgi:uncharacterized delta-60 repeat protein